MSREFYLRSRRRETLILHFGDQFVDVSHFDPGLSDGRVLNFQNLDPWGDVDTQSVRRHLLYLLLLCLKTKGSFKEHVG